MRTIHDVRIAEATLALEIEDGYLRSLGAVHINGVPLRNPQNRWLPWFDTLDGDIFRRFRFLGVEQRGDETVIRTRALSDPDVLFAEKRDSSGDLCFRSQGWDAEPLEAEVRIVLAPADLEVDNRLFTGFRYWFEYESDQTLIHRLADRQTWELGGNLDDVTVVCRSLFTLPRQKLSPATSYSTAGLDHPAGLMPGSQWARWTLLPPFDLQYGQSGILLAHFDRVSLIRSVLETMPGEDWLRVIDLHAFENSTRVATNSKTILHCPDRLDDTDALNLWTRIQDLEHEKARRQFDLPAEAPPAVAMSIGETCWQDFHFDTSYDTVLETAIEFGADYMGTDAVWENGEALRKTLAERIPAAERAGTALAKFANQNMCCTLDFEVAQEFGGEVALKRLCERAAAKQIGVIIWFGLHVSPMSRLLSDPALGHGQGGIIAAKESGRHPDTGYVGHCWTLNLNAPIGDRVREQILGVCRRCGVTGIRWDSFSNLGWWQVDYSKGDLRPQFDKMTELYAAMIKAGVRVWPEAVVAFSSQSCCGLHGGDVYAGDLLGYSYNSAFPLGPIGGYAYPGDRTVDVLTGAVPVDLLFRCLAHKRVPPLSFHAVPREKWSAPAVVAIKEMIRAYRACRDRMVRRTVLKDDAGVLWEDGNGSTVFFSFRDQAPVKQALFSDALTGETVERLLAGRVYVRHLECGGLTPLCSESGGQGTTESAVKPAHSKTERDSEPDLPPG